ncbi:MAG: CvpA family protein, partial [Desulfuromonadaceae bacterium]
DIVILSILGIFLIKGIWRGLLKETCSLLGLLLGAFLAFRFHAPIAEALSEVFTFPLQLCVLISFLVLFLTTVLIFALVGYFLSRLVKLIFLGGFNRVAGGFFGLLQGGVLLALVLFGLSSSQLPVNFDRMLKGAELAPPFVQLGGAIFQGSIRVLDGGNART